MQHHSVRYLALSYIWGGVDQLRITTKSIASMSASGAFSRPEFLSKIPVVIQDAIKFVQELGESYLWVDALCII
jgi:hypothetical protein